MANVVSTVLTLGATYVPAVTNLMVGGGLTRSLGGSAARIEEEIRNYTAIQQIAQQAIQEVEELPEESDAIILDSAPVRSRSYRSLNHLTQLDSTVEKIATIQSAYIDRTKADRQLEILRNARTVDRTNQASAAVQLVMGGAQVAVATSSLGHATTSVMNLVVGFSIFSSILFLGASVYGFATALNQLTENKAKQEAILSALDAIDKIQANTGDIRSLKDVEKAALEHTLKTLKAEEALLLQQRNAQAINIVAALLAVAAMVVFTAGTSGVGPVIYYVLLAASVILPLVAIGYSGLSMNDTKYMKELLYLFETAPVLPILPHRNDTRSIEELQLLLTPILGLGITDNATRAKLRRLLDELNSKFGPLDETGKAMRVKSLSNLFKHLVELQKTLIAEDLACRLRIAGMSVKDLEPPKVTQPSRTQQAIAYLKKMIFDNEQVPALAPFDPFSCLVPFPGIPQKAPSS